MFPDLLRDDVFRLETARLWLRWPRAADAVALSKLGGDPQVASLTASVPHPYTPDHAARWIFSSRAGNAQGASLAVVLARRSKPNEAIGALSLHQTRIGVARLGFWLGAPFHGMGFGQEAVNASVGLAFQVGGVSEIHAHVQKGNDRARRVLAAVGFRGEGSGPIDLPARGGVFTCERLRLDREGWLARSSGAAPQSQNVRSAASC